MKLTLGQIYNGLGALNQFGSRRLPHHISAFRLARIIALLTPEYQRIEQARADLVRTMGEKKENGDHEVPPAKMPQFTKALNELLSGDSVELDFTPVRIEQIPEDMLPDPLSFSLMMWAFTEPEEWPREIPAQEEVKSV